MRNDIKYTFFEINFIEWLDYSMVSIIPPWELTTTSWRSIIFSSACYFSPAGCCQQHWCSRISFLPTFLLNNFLLNLAGTFGFFGFRRWCFLGFPENFGHQERTGSSATFGLNDLARSDSRFKGLFDEMRQLVDVHVIIGTYELLYGVQRRAFPFSQARNCVDDHVLHWRMCRSFGLSFGFPHISYGQYLDLKNKKIKITLPWIVSILYSNILGLTTTSFQHYI